MAELNYRDGFLDLETKIVDTRAGQDDTDSNLVFDDEDMVFVSRQEAIDFEKEAEFVPYSLPERAERNVSAGDKIFAELSSFVSFVGNNVVPAASAALGQSAEYIKAAFTQYMPSKTEAIPEESNANAKTYGQIGLRFAEAAIVKVMLPAAAFCAYVPVIGATVAASTLTTCAVNVVGLSVKSGATQIAAKNAEWFNDSVDFGLSCFNENIVGTTLGLCRLEHKALYGIQGVFGQGVSTLVNNIEDPSSIVQAGKIAVNCAFSAWDSIKSAYAYSFGVSETVQCSGESESLDSESSN